MESLRQTSNPINVYGVASDVDNVYTFSPTPQSSMIDSTRETPPRCIQSIPPISGQSPRTKFMEGFRRRRQRSINLPTGDSLDEDLGYPPICSPPPEVITSSERNGWTFRSRSQSDAYSGMNIPNLSVRRQSGVLVIFPHSPAQNQQESNTRPALITTSSKSFDGPLPVGGASSSSSRDGRSSPRRPLFVDTQLANNGDKKKSPVASMVDFVRGRNRTTSLNLSGPPTPSSPQPISARASASAEGPMSSSPVHRNGRPPPLSRLYRLGMRSFDSGLDLSSPIIAHSALFIKESTLFSSFDSMTIGAAAADINAVFYDCADSVYSLFMKAHKCYDLIPTSTKLVVFDTHLPVRKAFYALVYNGVRAAPLWDSAKQKFIGMLTITDFIKILIKHYGLGHDGEKMLALEEEEISHWREQFEQDGCITPLVSIDPHESLHRAVQVLCESKVHRLPVMDRGTGNISYILTHKRLIKFLSLYMHDLPRPAFMDKCPSELGIGSWGDILTIHVDTPLHDALEIFLKSRVSALPLVDESGRVVDIYAKFDVISLAAEKSYDKLDCTVQEALTHRSEWFEGVQCCRAADSLFSVLEAIVKAEVHRLIVTDADRKVVGIISLSDILKYLVLDSVPSRESADNSSFSLDQGSPISEIPEE